MENSKVKKLHLKWDDEDTIRNKIYEHQRNIILEAITNYLTWRNDKNIPDNRGYTVTLFTYLRHFTNFGLNRAHNLRQSISSSPFLNPIRLLQIHLRQNSKLMNHSLDTYILESILKNKVLFLITEEITDLNSHDSRINLRRIILEQNTSLPPSENAFNIAQLFENNITENHLQNACHYYALAMQLDHFKARNALERLTKNGSSVAQYTLGYKYYYRKRELTKAISYCLQAAEQHHAEAITFLNDTQFDDHHYLSLASHYEEKNDITQAIYFYERAFTANNKEAALRLGGLHDPFRGFTVSASSNQIISHKPDALKAFRYYQTAAQQHSETALSCMASIAENLNDDNLRFQVSLVYIEPFGKIVDACLIYKQFIDNNVAPLVNQVHTILKNNSKYAFIMGELYEHDVHFTNHLEKAQQYYVIAMQSGHIEARSRIERSAKNGDCHSQYLVGFEYHHQRGEISEAISYCLQAAEQQHLKAIAYLNDTLFDEQQYLELARHYEQKDDISRAVYFYEKALATNNKDAAFRMGQLHDPFISQCSVLDFHQSIEKDAVKSFDYYMIAAKKKHEKALASIRRISNELDNDIFRYNIAEIYFYDYEDPESAFSCLISLAEKKVTIAITKLKELTNSSAVYAHLVGRLYEKDNAIDRNIQKAGYYYLLAIQQSNLLYNNSLLSIIDSDSVSTDDLNYLALLCFKGLDHVLPNFSVAYQCFEKITRRNQSIKFDSNLLADYHLGLLFLNGLGVQPNLVNAAKHFILAETKGSEEAKLQLETLINSNRLNSQQLIEIANLYFIELQNIITDWPRIVRCYKNASKMGDHSATRWLAQYYQVDHVDIPKNNKKSFKFYFQLASSGDPDALPPLERLGDEVNSQEQKSLSQLYKGLFNHERATYWQERAEEAETLTLNVSTGL